MTRRRAGSRPKLCPACQVRDSLVERAREKRHGMPAAVETAFMVGFAMARIGPVYTCSAHAEMLGEAMQTAKEIYAL